MKMLLSVFAIIMLIMLILTTILNLVSKKTTYDREKSSPFECGFDPKTHSRLPFSLQFFLIGIIFMIFDIEIAILLPMIYTLKTANALSYMLTTIGFIMILIIGILHEWKQGSLNWTL
uniref:NADH-ubiquinone oxidoreductase chain 3 n=1 Tax=Chrysodinopsis sp. EMHAU-1507081 TaxID=2480059 RepID=A0A3G3C787_9CUCU|nr:NADH dehydrogenase subunit 3 [Chrysodinopsis sp. EMHAU-1507081]